MGSLDDRLAAMDGGDTAAAKKRRATVASGKSDLLSQMLGGASSDGGQLTREALDTPSKPRPGRSASMTMTSPTSGEMRRTRASSDRTSKELAVQPPPAAAAFQVPPSEELKKFKAAVLKAVEEELKALSMATSKTALAPYKPTEEGALPPTRASAFSPSSRRRAPTCWLASRMRAPRFRTPASRPQDSSSSSRSKQWRLN